MYFRNFFLIFVTIFTLIKSTIVYATNVEIPMKEAIKQRAQALFDSAMQGDKPAVDRIYTLSMPLIASAAIQYSDLNQAISTQMDAGIDAVKPASMQAWMMGRMLLAANLMNDKSRVDSLKEQILAVLEVADLEDVKTGWAYGYLLTIDKTLYQAYREKLFVSVNNVAATYSNDKTADNLSSLLWTLTMNMDAAASTSHQDDYKQFLRQISSLTGYATITDSVAAMPDGDFPAWLVSINLRAATMMDDTQTQNELQTLLTETFKRPIVDADKMLAQANQFLINTDLHGKNDL